MKFITSPKKAAFTLAETLITLGIIGIVAAMTIPNLITAHQKKVIPVKLQRAISVMNQAYRLAYADIGEATPAEVHDMGGEEYVEKYWAPYLKISNICNTYKDCGYKSRQPFRELDNSKATNEVKNVKDHVIWFQTIEGFVYAVYYYKIDESTIASFMYVDITGGSGPNIYGKDLFILSRVIEGEKGGSIVPTCAKYNKTQLNNGCKKGGHNSSNCCAEVIRRAGWKIDRSYPW